MLDKISFSLETYIRQLYVISKRHQGKGQEVTVVVFCFYHRSMTVITMLYGVLMIGKLVYELLGCSAKEKQYG